MKKTISINIGGMIFHIEEDGYDRLKGYLTAIQQYFSNFADSKEIVMDIESRIAERFYKQLKQQDVQAITLEDVEALIGAMGTVADFEAIEQAEDLFSEPLPTASPASPQSEAPANVSTATASTDRPRFYRDLKRKLLGGVAAGLAHRASLDPLWVRLLFLVFFFGMPAMGGALGLEDIFGPLSGFALILYIAMWVAFPGSATLEEDQRVKKFYRNPDQKVIGGVASGVGLYFGIEVGVVRLLWVLSVLLFGSGLILYLILWAITPYAHTLTEKMEMQGEPITLSNIESNIKKGLNIPEEGSRENTFTKILLLPFRAIGVVIAAASVLLKNVGPLVRILIGLMLILLAVSSLLTILIGGGIGIGFRNFLPINEFSPFMILEELPASLLLSLLLVALIPFVAILLLGLRLVAGRKIVSSTVWLSLSGVWVIALLASIFSASVYQANFARRAEVEVTDHIALPSSTFVLDHNDTFEEEHHWHTQVKILGYEGDSMLVKSIVKARGRTIEDAEQHARSLQYQVIRRDTAYLFSDGPRLAPEGKFRDQRMTVTAALPYDRVFTLTRSFYYENLSRSDLHDKYRIGYEKADALDWQALRWTIKRDSGLVCLNLPLSAISEGEEDELDSDLLDDSEAGIDLGERGAFSKQFEVSDFRAIDLSGAYSVLIKRGEECSISADGEEVDIQKLRVRVNGGVLRIEQPKELFSFGMNKKRIGLVITLPSLDRVSLSGASKGIIRDFDQLSTLTVELSGASKAEANVRAERVITEVSGASQLLLKGNTRLLEASVGGASGLNTQRMRIQEAEVEASGASRVRLGSVPSLRQSASGASRIEANE